MVSNLPYLWFLFIFKQVEASIEYVCVGPKCEMGEFCDVLQEMDRRYYLIQDLRWEFTMLDREQKDTISEEQAKWVNCI